MPFFMFLNSKDSKYSQEINSLNLTLPKDETSFLDFVALLLVTLDF